MRKKRLIVWLAAAIAVLTFPTAAYAAVMQSDSASDIFTEDSAVWETAGDAELSEGQTGLLMNMPNDWQPHMVNNKVQIPSGEGGYAFDVTMDFDVRDRGLGGRIGFGIGLPANTSHIYNCGALVTVSLNGELLVWVAQNAARTNVAANNSFSTGALEANYMQGKRLTLKVHGEQRDNGRYDLDVYIKQQSESDDEYNHLKAANLDHSITDVYADGYVSIASVGNSFMRANDGMLSLVKNFSVTCKKAADTVVDYSTNFGGDNDKISYPSSRNDTYDWRLSGQSAYAPESAFFMGTCHEVSFVGSKDGKLVGSDSLFIDQRSDKILDVKYTVRLSALPENAYFGFGTGLSDKASPLDERNMVYLKRTGNVFHAGVLTDGKESQDVTVSAPNLNSVYNKKSTMQLYYKIFYDTLNKYYCVGFYACIGAPGSGANPTANIVKIADFKDIDIDGYYGLGTAAVGETAGADAEVYAATITPYDYFVSGASDDTIDFLGIRTQKVLDESIDYPYYRTSKWFISGDENGVLPPRMLQSGEMHQYLEFDVTPVKNNPLTAFGPKGMYGDYIFRYTLTDAAHEDDSYIALSFGRQNIEGAITSYPLIMFSKQGGAMQVSWQNLTERSGLTQITDSDTNFFAKPGASYDVMLIAQNGTVSLYYTEKGQDNYTQRAVFDNVSTAGFIAVSGNTQKGYSYKVTSMAINKCDAYDRITGDTETATNLSEWQLNDIAQIDFSTDYINDTRFSVGKGISVADGRLRFANTTKKAAFATKGRFDNFSFDFDIVQKFNDTDVVINFGKSEDNPYGCSIRFLAGTNMVELDGLMNTDNNVLFEIPYNIYNYDGVMNAKLVCIGDEVTLYLKKDTEPSTQLGVAVAEMRYLPGTGRTAGSVSLGTSAGGNMVIDNFRVMSLNFGIDIITENYGGSNRPPMTDLTAKEEPTTPEKKGCGSSVAASGFGLALIPALAMLVWRKKDEKND